MRLLLLACLLLAVHAAPAAAHAILMESQPGIGATVPAGSTALSLRFNSRIDRARSRLELRPAAAGSAATPLPLSASGADTLNAQVPLAPGSWVLRWQVLAVDGHMTRGDVPFTVQPGNPPAPVQTP